MSSRIKMNSKNLQEKFPEVYSDLFSKCSIVTSAPSLFHWAGEYAMNFGGPVVSQKIPLRVYVGLEPTNKKNKIEFGSFLLYLTSKRTFRENNYYEYLDKKNLERLDEVSKKMNDGNDFNGFKINAIFEVPKYSGLNSSAAFLAALIPAIALFFKKITLEDYLKAKELSISDLIDFEKFDFIFREAWKMNSSMHHGISSGASIFCSMVNSKYPLVYFTDARGGEDHPLSYKLHNGHLSEIDKIKYSAFDLGEFFDLDKIPEWNIDFGLIYSGGVKPLNRISRSILNINDSLRKTIDFAKSNDEGKKLLSFFHNNKKDKNIDEIIESYISSLSYLTLDIIKSIKESFSIGRDESLVRLFRSINLYDGIMYFLNGDFFSVNSIGNYIRESASEDNSLGVATKICGVGRGGDILFVGPGGSLFAYVNDIMSFSNKKISIDYLSWEDGYESNGLMIEQFIDSNIYSKFISHNSVRLSKLDENETIQTEVIPKDQLDMEINNIDILLDEVMGGIFIKGKKLSSKEILSAKYTIEFLKILLKNQSKELSNKELPRSSYSTNRNEFQGKILVPLQKEIKKRLKKDLLIDINGTLDDFKLKLKSNNCKIYFLEKLF